MSQSKSPPRAEATVSADSADLHAPTEPLPYYKWFVRDWRASRSVQHMGYIARGLYRELLDEQWLVGFVPDDIAKLAEIADCPEEVMNQEWPRIKPHFEKCGRGKLVNKKLETRRTDSDRYRVQQAQHGKKGGRKKKSPANIGVPGGCLEGGEKASLPPPLSSENRSPAEAERCEQAPDTEDDGWQSQQSQSTSQSNSQRRAFSPGGVYRTDARLQDFVNVWNENRGTLDAVRKLTDTRRQFLRKRIREGLTLETFAEAVRKCAATPFTSGAGALGWKANFDFLVGNDTNLVKVLEGSYDGGNSSNGRSWQRAKTDGNAAAAREALRLLADRKTRRDGRGEAGGGESDDVRPLRGPLGTLPRAGCGGGDFETELTAAR